MATQEQKQVCGELQREAEDWRQGAGKVFVAPLEDGVKGGLDEHTLFRLTRKALCAQEIALNVPTST